MTISTSTATVTQNGNGATTVWNYSFLIPFQDDDTTPAATVQLLSPAGVLTTIDPSLYTIAGVANPAGGSVTYPLVGSPLAAGWKITIARALDYIQPFAFGNQSFAPKSIEDLGDELAMQSQQLHALAARSFYTAPGEAGFQMPGRGARQNLLLGFDGNGDPALLAQSGGGGGGGTAFDYLFAYNSGDLSNSLFAQTVVTGKPYVVVWGDDLKQPGSSATWIPLDTTAYPPTGTFGWSQDATYGHIRDGVHAQFYLVHDGAADLDIRMALVRCDATNSGSPNYQCNGGTVGQMALVASLITWAGRAGFGLTGGGALRIDIGETINVIPTASNKAAPSLHWGEMILICSVGFTGWMISGPTDMHDTEAFEVDLVLWGDNAAFNSSSQARGFQYIDDSGALQSGRVRAAYLFHGMRFYKNCEDKNFQFYAEFCTWGATQEDRCNITAGSITAGILTVVSVEGPGELEVGMTCTATGFADFVLGSQITSTGPGGIGTWNTNVVQTVALAGPTVYTLYGAQTYTAYPLIACVNPGGASPDDIALFLQAHNVSHYFWQPQNADCSIKVTFNTQNRKTLGDGYAAVTIGTGKSSCITGLIRGHNGPEDCIQLYKDHGISAIDMTGLFLEHGYATAINALWVARITGNPVIRDYSNSNNGGNSTVTLLLGRVVNAGNFLPTIIAGGSTAGITTPCLVGTPDFIPTNVNFGPVVIQVGSPEPYNSTTALGEGLRLAYGQNMSFTCAELDGNVYVGAGIGQINLELPSTWLTAQNSLQTFTGPGGVPSAPNNALQVLFTGGCFSDDIFDKTWLFNGIRLDRVIDLDGSPFVYMNGFWDPVGTIRASTILLGSLTSRFNANMAGAGVRAWDKGNARPMWKSASTAAAVWKDGTNANANTVGYQAITNTFTARIAAAGGVAPPDNSIEKDGLDILFTTFADETWTPAAAYWWCLAAAYADAGRAAVRLNMLNTSFGLTEHNYVANWTGANPGAGYTGGGTFYMDGGPSVLAGDGGMSLNSTFFLWNTLTQPTTSNNPDFADAGGLLKGKFRHDNGGSFAVNDPTLNSYSAAAGPVPGMRGAARYAAADKRGYANAKLDITYTTASSTAAGPLEFFRFQNGGAPLYTDRKLSFFLIGPKPTDDSQAIRIIRGVRRGLNHAGKTI